MRVRKTNDQPDTHFSRTGKVLGFKKFGWKARDTVPFKDYKIHGCMSVDLLLHKQMTLMFLCTVYIQYICVYIVSLAEFCPVPNLRCGSGECVPPANLCDGEFDCADGQDERNCRNPSRCLVVFYSF